MQNPLERKIFSVSNLTDQIKIILEEGFPFVWISGEISNFKSPVSGHHYFTLKDSQAQINAIMFRGQNRNLKFLPQDGMKIIGFGRISVYPPRGAYQIIMEYLEPAGAGALQAAFEQLKSKLAAEGLFDSIHKKALPFLPSKIHLITSPSGSVVHDMIRVLHRRYPNLEICIIPVKVQGTDAIDEIVSALALLNTLSDAEIAIIARGGGSLEDLSAFNAEPLARAIFASRIPVISAVGHETDFTIADFVSDLRAPTPSAAAELAVPVKSALIHHQALLFKQLCFKIETYLQHRSQSLCHLTQRMVHPRKRLEELKIRLDDALMRMHRSIEKIRLQKQERLAWRTLCLEKNTPQQRIHALRHCVFQQNERLLYLSAFLINTKKLRLKEQSGRLQALNPTAVLDRGYSIIRSIPDRHIITHANETAAGQLLEILLAKGSLVCRVEKDISDGEKKDI